MNKKDINDLNERIWNLKDKEYYEEDDPFKQMWALIADLSLLQAEGQKELKNVAQSVAMLSTLMGILTEKISELEEKINDKK
tara:strand:- start:118 stop:363 length:246 start_codon:yes stop_codon:yes gene_type:complete